MSRPSGTHDTRQFRHFAKMAKDGSVAAIVEVADGHPDPVDGEQSVYVEVTDLYPYDFAGVIAPSAIVPVIAPNTDVEPTKTKTVNLVSVKAELMASNLVKPPKGDVVKGANG